MSDDRPLKVVVLDDYQGVAQSFAPWTQAPVPLDMTFQRVHIHDEEELIALLSEADAIVAMRERTRLPARITTRLPRLRLIVTTGMRNAAIENAPGIMICGTSSLVSPTVELTWALILAHRRGIVDEARSLDSGGWQVGVGEGLEGTTLGLVGLGNIGARVARVGLAFGMDVIAWSENLTHERAAEHGVRAVPFPELLESSDVLSIHTRLSDRTRGLLGRAEFAAMKPAAIVVNTSRAEITDETALAEAVHAGEIAGAAVDVYTSEPLGADSVLRGIPGILRTPHLGYVTRQNYEIYFREALEAIVAFAQGSPIRVIADGT